MKNAYYFLRISCLALGSTLALSATAQTLDPSFQQPRIMGTGSSGPVAGEVHAIVRQPDGKYVIGGSFSSINGVRVRNLARLHADGTLDVAFTASSGANRPVYALALQPDGRIVAGGQFDSLAGSVRRSVGRLQATGTLDAAFDANLTNVNNVRQVALLPGGDILALQPTSPSNYSAPSGLFRLRSLTGQVDPSFQQTVAATRFAVQPDGRIITGGSAASSYVQIHLLARLLPSGALDNSFSPWITHYSSTTIQVKVGPNGGIYRLGYGHAYSGLSGPGIFRGEWRNQVVTDFEVQPNGRLLGMGYIYGLGSAGANLPITSRLLADGSLDAGYVATNGPLTDALGAGSVNTVLVQPDGALLMGGSFTRVGTTPVHGLVRMLDANVLNVKTQLAENATTVSPVPAHGTLNVTVEPSACPRRVELLDALGRAVLTQAVATGRPALTLDVAALAAGSYVLRVSYEQAAPVVRRVVLE